MNSMVMDQAPVRAAARVAPIILLIDDEQRVRDTTCALLQRDGYTLHTAADGASGLQKALELLPDLILLDIMMPGMDGFEVCRQLRSHPSLCEVPVVMITALDDQESRLEGLEAGADDFVCKPYNRAELQARVRTVVRLNRYRRLLQERERFARLAELAPYGLVLADIQNGICFANPAFSKMLGFNWGELQSRSVVEFVEPELQRVLALQLKQLEQTGQSFHNVETRLIHAGGEGFWVAVDGGLIEWERSTVLQLVFRDISETRRYQSELEHRTNFDTLTGLANRNLLNDRLDQALTLRAPQQLGAVLMLDLDRLRDINEALSTAAGDHVLREVAHRLTATLAGGSTIARYAGDQFAVVVPQLEDAGAAGLVAGQLLSELSRPVDVGERQIVVTARLGMTLFPTLGNEREELLQQAEVALYTCKQEARGFRLFEPDMQRGIPARLEMENGIRDGLTRAQFRLFFQPRVDRRGHLAGAEALVRWQHPERGLVSPQEFIPLAEETGLIIPLGRWVLREAARQLASWRDQGLRPLNLGINVSPRQFADGDLINLCREVLEEFRLPAESLGLEITESATMEDPHAALRTLESLHQLGVELSLDDFGTGYSSLSYLTRMPLTYLKIDRSFVQNVTTRCADAVLASKLIGMAQSMGFRTVVEGVETVDQLQFVLERGCDQIQGFYFSKPLPPAEFGDLLRNGHTWSIPVTVAL